MADDKRTESAVSPERLMSEVVTEPADIAPLTGEVHGFCTVYAVLRGRRSVVALSRSRTCSVVANSIRPVFARYPDR